jgi:hypothetical protein
MTKIEVLKVLDSLAYEMRIVGMYGDKPIDGYNKVIDWKQARIFIEMIDEATP